MPIPRRLRGLLGLAAVGAVAWEFLLVILLVVTPIFSGGAVPWRRLPQVALGYGAVGAACGILFGLILLLMERKRAFGDLTIRRVALWGALGSISLSLLFMTVLGARGSVSLSIFAVSLFGIAGAVVSAGTLAIARKAPVLPEPTVKELEGE